MSTPNRKILEMFEAARKQAKITFQTERDANGQARWTKELVLKLGAPVHIVPLSSQLYNQNKNESSGVDPLYGDILNPEYLESRLKINARALIEHSPSIQRLERFGINEIREIIFWFSYHELKDLGLVDDKRFRGMDIGDFVIWDGTWYKADHVHRANFFGQTDFYYFTGVFCNRYHLNSISTESPTSDFKV